MSTQPIDTTDNEPTAETLATVAAIRDNTFTLPLPLRARIIRGSQPSKRILGLRH